MIGAVNLIGAVTAPVIFSQIHFLLISANEFFPEIKRDGITSLHGIHDVQIYRPVTLVVLRGIISRMH